MRRSILLLAAAAALTGCAMDGMPPPEGTPAPPMAEVYHAVGTEPGWALTIGGGEMAYVGDYGETHVTVATPDPRTTFNGHRYETPRLTVDITHSPCSDGMSDRRYPDTVMVITNAKTVHGCGGLAPAGETGSMLEGTHWEIEAIDGRSIALDRPTSIDFTADRIEGRAGCNSFGGRYQVIDGVLTTSQVVSTKMACPGRAMEVENAFFAIIDGPATLQQQGRRLVVSSDAGTVTLREVLRP
jgi:heat shock protein HslJ